MYDPLRGPWLRCLALNPAAPSDVLLRLLDPAAGDAGPLMCAERGLPDPVIDAALRHPARRIRQALARNEHVDPARLAPLATDPSGIVRAWLAGAPRPRRRAVRPLPDDIIITLLTARDGGADGLLTADEIIQELDFSWQVPQAFHRAAAGHKNAELRVHAARQWHLLTRAQRELCSTTPAPRYAKRPGRPTGRSTRTWWKPPFRRTAASASCTYSPRAP
ncbi:hypothetical protein [Streptomyces sp. NPDC090112]|uniref:hypothetical protein n=1 Tax=Streptomyces sp. NPDC090112 TaxID=3365949 RepID=UPI0037F94459